MKLQDHGLLVEKGLKQIFWDRETDPSGANVSETTVWEKTMVEVYTTRGHLAALGLALAVVVAVLPVESWADMYGFKCISNATAENIGTGESQLSVEVSDYGASSDGYERVLFTFRNTGLAASSITDVYFDDGTLLSLADLIDRDQNNGHSGVDFTQRALSKVCPPDLPDGEAITPRFDVTAGFSADSDSPATQANGVNPGEYLGVIFKLQSGLDFADLLSAIDLGLEHPEQTGNLRIGIHVQGFANGDSASFVNGPPVPLPGAVLLGMLGMTVAGWRLRRFA